MRTAALLAFVLSACSVGAAPLPASTEQAGVISLDYCADQMVLGLLPRERIVAVSPEADSDSSFSAPRAKGLPRVRPSVEAVMQLRPRFAVRLYGGAPGIDRQLSALGVRVIQLEPAFTLGAVPGELTRVGRLLDADAQAHRIAARFRRDLAQHAAPTSAAQPRPTLLYMTPGDVTTGPDGFVGEIIRYAGFRSVRRENGWGSLPLETLVREPPDAVLRAFFDSPRYRQDRWSSSAHPRLKAAIADVPTATVPGGSLGCGNWLAGAAVRELASLRRQVRPTP
jgi:iron complex transport system substrate-binding protein